MLLKKRVKFLLLILVGIVFYSQVYSQTDAYGKPVGFTRLEIPANTQRLTSIPFVPFDSSLNAIFNGQLTGDNNDEAADKLIKWVSTQEYKSAFKAANTGDPAKEGKWFENDTNWTPTDLTLSPSEGIWIQNQHGSQQVFLMGKLILDDTQSVSLYQNMNLFSFPFTSKIALNDTTLKNDGAHGAAAQNASPGPDVISKVNPDTSWWLLDDENSPNNGKWLDINNILANEYLKPGVAYWYNRQIATSFTWNANRPYQNPFNVSASAPEITGMSINSSLNEITLNISCTGAAGETLEILYKDVPEDASLVTESGWSVAATGIATNSATTINWTDIGESNPSYPLVTRSAVTSPHMRLYLVIRADYDEDEDGLPTGREIFCTGTSPSNPDSDGDGLSDNSEITTYHTDAFLYDTDNDGISDGQEILFNMNPHKAAVDEDGYKHEFTVLEDAEDGNTTNWAVYDADPAGATITNEIDFDNVSNHVIKLAGTGTQNGYRYTFAVPEDNEFKLEWKMKYSESYTVYISCTTTAGHRYIYYTASSTDALGTAEYVHHGLGTATKDGKWHTIRRDLVKDLHDAQPDVEILKVNAFLVRGSGYIDDIKTYIYADADKDLIPDGIETAAGLNPNDASDAKGDIDGDGLTNIAEFMLGTNIANADTDGDGINDAVETANGFNPLDGTDASLDSDGDGLTNLQELALGMDPNKAAVDENGYKNEFTILEDAEDGTITNWAVYDADPAGATITNEIDSDNVSNHVIKLAGTGTQNGYRYTFAVPEDNEFKLEWRMKYSESYTVYISCTTTVGHRYIYYTASSTDALGTAEYVHHGLGTATKDGKWHTIRRDLVKDFHDAQPDVEILKVNAFLVRGSGYIDDIKTYMYADADKDVIPDAIETAAGLNPNDASDAKGDIDGDGLTNIEEFMLGTNIANADSDGDGLSDSYEINNGFNPLDGTDASLDSDGDGLTNLQELALGMDPNKAAVDENGYKYEFTVQEDGEDGATTNWVVYDADPAGATITNEIDFDNVSNHVIKLAGTGTQNGYRYTFAVPEDNEFKLEWKMKYSESYTVYISCTTTAGHRYIYYTASVADSLGTAEYVHHGLGTATKDGKWHTIRRDLVKDLHDAQADVEILKVNAFLVRGSGYIDDIKTYMYADADRDLIPDGIETAAGLNPNDASDAKGDLDGDGLTNIEEFMLGVNIANADTDGDGVNDAVETANELDPNNPNDPGALVLSVIFPLESVTIR